MLEPRPSQKVVLSYRQGKMGVSAVPGSGKTFTLAHLAADLVTEAIQDEQEVLVVTLVNSAVDNIAGRIDRILLERKLLPRFGYRVRTLHGLAHDIVRERPVLVGLAEDFQIVDDRVAADILRDCCEHWMKAHAAALDGYLKPDLTDGEMGKVRREWLPDLLQSMMTAFIRQAKNRQLSPETLWVRLADREQELPLAYMGAVVYADYQQALNYRGGVDFDDLIRFALDALRSDDDYLDRLRNRWVYILEDEAQDSSALQEQILQTLAGETGNWVRVGDPNQAIFETFTTASPEFLRAFLKRQDVIARELPESGRSRPSIIALANRLIDWTMYEHPTEPVRSALSPPKIQPVSADDCQPNPPDAPDSIWIGSQELTSEKEIDLVVNSVQEWLKTHPDQTVAILAPTNDRGFKFSEALRTRGIRYIELLQSTTSTRQTAHVLAAVLKHLAEPTAAKRLADVFRVWRRQDSDSETKGRLNRLARRINRCRRVEDYLWPRFEGEWLEAIGLNGAEQDDGGPEDDDLRSDIQVLQDFRQTVARWQKAVLLPIDQLLLTIAQDLFHEAVDLALTYKFALLLRDVSDEHPDWGLEALAEGLLIIARNQRKFLGLSDDDTAFDPNKYPGTVVVATMHKAKGLEWDRVYLTSVNNYDFPSAQAHDSFVAEKWFVRDSLNLQAECLKQLETAIDGSAYQEGEATRQDRLAYVAERLRLLYVGITRARKQVIITWNTGTSRTNPAQQAVPLIALRAFHEEQMEKAMAEQNRLSNPGHSVQREESSLQSGAIAARIGGGGPTGEMGSFQGEDQP